jgi:hypothetical protein
VCFYQIIEEKLCCLLLSDSLVHQRICRLYVMTIADGMSIAIPNLGFFFLLSLS